MNIFKKAYCRVFQFVFKLALPFLPYRDPELIGSIEDVAGVLEKDGKTKPLIVTDKTVAELGLVDGLTESLSAHGTEYALFDGVVANPTTDNVASALEMYRAEGCDSLIAFGGGSPMDCAKGVGALVARPKKTLDRLGGILKVRKKIPTLVAVPTTAGTGSETTLACVIVDGSTRRKFAINDFPLIPRYAVLDEGVTMTLPRPVVATTGMDALTHAIEAFIGKSGNKSTRRDALEAIKLVFDNLPESYEAGTRASRKQMLLAAHKAGRAFSKAYVGYVHALAHALGGKYNVPHGLANAVILPIVLREYGKAAHKKLRKIAVYCGLASKTDPASVAAQAVIEKIERFNAEFGIPQKLDCIDDGDLDGLAAHADREANPLYPVPVLWDKKKLKAMFVKIREEKTVGGNL